MAETLLRENSDDFMEKIRPQIRIRLAAESYFFGPGVEELMLLIEKNGSIQKACMEMGLSYSKGSRMIKKMEKQMGFPVVRRWTGGAGGGGANLTEEGRRLVRCYGEMVRQVQESTEEIYRKCFAGVFVPAADGEEGDKYETY